MEEYMEEALQQGCIRPSTSPAASSLFLVKKMNGGLQSCIDYRALNKIMIKYHYPFLSSHRPSSSCEEPRCARSWISAAHTTWSEYGWKTAFITPSGYYEYCVMPYGLANAPSVFKGCMKEVFR